jgi:hypothetical protein
MDSRSTCQTVYTFFSMMTSLYNFNIPVGGEKIKRTESMQYLGVTLDSKMTGSLHLEYAAEKKNDSNCCNEQPV